MKTLILDIETAPNTVFSWGLFKQNIAINQIVKPSYLLCWAAKWHNKPKVHFRSLYHHDKDKMLRDAYALLEQADAVVHFNGERFDIPVLNQEFALMGWPRPSSFAHIDLLKVVRQQFRLPSNKLAFVAHHFGLGEKAAANVFELWEACMAGKAWAWKEMKAYNIHDIILTERVYDRLLPWITQHPNHGLEFDAPVCVNCGGHSLERRGMARTKTMEYQRYQCKDCGSWSRDRLAEKKDRKHLLTGVAI